jgi:hypothetical protein
MLDRISRCFRTGRSFNVSRVTALVLGVLFMPPGGVGSVHSQVVDPVVRDVPPGGEQDPPETKSVLLIGPSWIAFAGLLETRRDSLA